MFTAKIFTNTQYNFIREEFNYSFPYTDRHTVVFYATSHSGPGTTAGARSGEGAGAEGHLTVSLQPTLVKSWIIIPTN